MTEDIHIEHWRVERLVPYARNARRHSRRQVEQIAASIQEFGFVNPILVDKDGVIVAGHARWDAARKLGMAEVPVIVLCYLTNSQRRALALADNKLPLHTGWTEKLLRAELEALLADGLNLDLTGFSDEETRARAIAEETTIAGNVAEDDTPELDATVTVSVPDDVWVMGKHRLVCGDAENLSTLQTALAHSVADMVFTNPPYNVDYEGKTASTLKTENNAVGGGFYEFLRAACANMLALTSGAVYICMSSSELHTLYRAFTDAGGHWSTFVIWAKHHLTLGRSDYQRQYEPILYGWREGSGHFWCGDRNQGDIWFVKRPMASRVHPTSKPVELVERAVRNSSKAGDVVLDPFAGSGSTLIACHKSNRRAALVEIDPRYCDVICRRFAAFAGEAPVLESSGRPFGEVAGERLGVAA